MKSSLRNVSLVSALLKWFAHAARDLPWRRTPDPYAIWVSEIMLQQTQVKTVIAYWARWMRNLPTVQALAEARPERIHKLWEGLGYYTRVRNMQTAAQQIVARHGGEFPRDFEAILELPGIGRYTAGAIASIAFNEPRPVLDGNVIRVLTRLFGIADNPKDKAVNARLWELSEDLVKAASMISLHERGPSTRTTTRLRSETSAYAKRLRRDKSARQASTIETDERCSHLNQSLMELGALVCIPKNPACSACPVRTACVAKRTGRTAELPSLGPRKAATARRFAAFVLERKGRYFVRQRPAGVVNAHLWEFPNVEIAPAADASELRDAARHALGSGIKIGEHIYTVKHSITRYRITTGAYRAVAEGMAKPDMAGEWRTLAQLRLLAFPSAHKRILHHVSNHAIGAETACPRKTNGTSLRRIC
jgi:A/G-specific adenine glycosylase